MRWAKSVEIVLKDSPGDKAVSSSEPTVAAETAARTLQSAMRAGAPRVKSIQPSGSIYTSLRRNHALHCAVSARVFRLKRVARRLRPQRHDLYRPGVRRCGIGMRRICLVPASFEGEENG